MKNEKTINNKSDKELDGFLTQKHFNSIKGWFLKRIGDKDTSDDLTSETILKFTKRVKTKKYNYNIWQELKLLSKIKKGVFVDYCRKQNQEKKILSLNSKITTKEGEESTLEDFLGEEDKNIQPGKKSFQKDPAFLLKTILSSPHRPLQEALLILLTPSFKKMRGKIEKRFPFIINRVVKKRGIYFEGRNKEEEPFSENEEKEMREFYDLLLSLAKELKIGDEKSVFNDDIGIQALKILLISKHKKGGSFDNWLILFNLRLLSLSQKRDTYLSFDEKGKLIKKKTIKRPSLGYSDKYWRTKFNQKKLDNFLLKHTQKYPDYPVNKEWVKWFFCIKDSKSSTIRKNRLRLNKKIKKYDLMLKDIIEKRL